MRSPNTSGGIGCFMATIAAFVVPPSIGDKENQETLETGKNEVTKSGDRVLKLKLIINLDLN